MTIKEIANSLNVSTATVSNVIHGHLEKMAPETAQLIRQKLEQYQYIPNMGARMLAKGDSEIVGVITNYPNREEKFALQDPFVSEMIAALENSIRSRGYYTMLHAAQNAAEIHRISQTWNAVGLIVMGLQANQCRELMQAARVRADEMAASGAYSHTRPDGRKYTTVTDCKYVGENIQLIGEWQMPNTSLPAAAVDGWQNSAAHLENMLNTRYGEIGIGLSQGTVMGEPYWYCVQLFLCDGYTIDWVDAPAVK